MLPRFYDIDTGAITIDGYDIRDLTLNSLRRQIGIVQQDVFLFGGTLLILDEATSALDTETEAIIQESLAALSAGRTTLIIAHRLATTRKADRILVVTETGIAEEGRPKELLAAGGLYARLHEAQFS